MSACDEINLPFVLDSSFIASEKNITLSIDDIEYVMKGDNWGSITKLHYTIINNASGPLVPELLVRVYQSNDSLYSKYLVHKVLKPEITLEKTEWVRKVDIVAASFRGEDTMVELELINTIPDPNQPILKLTMPLWEGTQGDYS